MDGHLPAVCTVGIELRWMNVCKHRENVCYHWVNRFGEFLINICKTIHEMQSSAKSLSERCKHLFLTWITETCVLKSGNICIQVENFTDSYTNIIE